MERGNRVFYFIFFGIFGFAVCESETKRKKQKEEISRKRRKTPAFLVVENKIEGKISSSEHFNFGLFLCRLTEQLIFVMKFNLYLHRLSKLERPHSLVRKHLQNCEKVFVIARSLFLLLFHTMIKAPGVLCFIFNNVPERVERARERKRKFQIMKMHPFQIGMNLIMYFVVHN